MIGKEEWAVEYESNALSSNDDKGWDDLEWQTVYYNSETRDEAISFLEYIGRNPELFRNPRLLHRFVTDWEETK